MTETKVADAVAAQRQHEKRSQSCLRQLGRPHVYRRFGSPTNPRASWAQCLTCGVTETHADYQARLGAP